MFALVDANSFYCSAEQVFDPRLRGQPVVVLSNNDGCIVAANKAALALGVKKFSPYFQMQALCQQKGIIARSSNYALYADISAKMMQQIAQFAPDHYIYSIDESFLDYRRAQHNHDEYEQLGQQLRRHVWRCSKLPVSVGFAPSLTLAKVANHLAKRSTTHQGVAVLSQPAHWRDILAATPVESIWGIGRRLGNRLRSLGIASAQQLANMPPKLARKQFSVELERTVLELNGIAAKQWESLPAPKKQIFSTRSVGERITDCQSLRQALLKHAAIAAQKLRAQQSRCRHMMLFANSSPFDERPVNRQATAHFATPTSCNFVMAAAIEQLLPQLYRADVRYYKIGVGLIDLQQNQFEQFDLFQKSQDNQPAMAILDTLNRRFGQGTLFSAGQAIEQKWQMRRQLLSKQYTTNWAHIPDISCK